MSLPDFIAFVSGKDVPPRFSGFPHRLFLLPAGISADALGKDGHRTSSVFLIEPNCAADALNDPTFDTYLRRRLPILVYARRARDLQLFLRRAEIFRRRGYGVEISG